MSRLKTILPLLLVPLLAGCIDDIVRSMIPVGPTDGEVWAPDGGSGFDADGLSSVRKLSLLRVKPNHGPFAGGTEAVISGTGFDTKVAVTFGGKAVQSKDITLLSPLALKVIVPAGAVGPAEVKVSRENDSATLAGGFIYDPVYLDPASGPTPGSTLVTIYGQGLTFTSQTTATLGGKALTELTLLSSSTLRGKTPAGPTGPADLVLSTGAKAITVEDAYTYYQAANPRSGGLGGGPIKGTLTVSVLNWLTSRPVPGAKVVLQKERSLQLSAQTDTAGAAVFSRPELKGPVTVTASLKGFESSTVMSFDARDLTIFLMPIPDPQPGPLPPGQYAGVVRGNVLFGGATGVGSTQWKLVPEPKTGQSKRVYVYSTVPSINWGAPYAGSGATVDFANSGNKAWPFTLYSRTGSLAIFAVAGIYTQATARFEPYAMGITRGVVVGPGEGTSADIWVNIPLTEQVEVQFSDLPGGVSRHQLRLALDLGADGLIMRQDHEVSGDGLLSGYTFGRLPALNHQGLIDATYTVEATFDAGDADGLPQSKATITMARPKAGVIAVDKFLGVPQQVRPQPGGTLQGNTLAWRSQGPTPDLSLTIISMPDQTPVWRIISPGTATVASLPDPTSFGLSAWPTGPLRWTQYLARLPGFSFDTFNYTHFSTRYWDRWSSDRFAFTAP